MKVSNYQFRLKYHTENKSTVRMRRLEYAREYGYKGEDVSPEDMAALEYLDAIECHMRELAARIDEGWKTAPVKEALSLPARRRSFLSRSSSGRPAAVLPGPSSTGGAAGRARVPGRSRGAWGEGPPGGREEVAV